MTYAENKKRAIYSDNTPTATDQAAANQSDINIIVGQQLTTGYAPGAPKPPVYQDWTEFPKDLREMLETSRQAIELRKRLPPQLRERTLAELLALTPDELKKIVEPPAPPPAPPDPEKK